MIRRIINCMLFATVLLLSGRICIADDFYVDADFGSDIAGDGSQASPWQHLQFAIDTIEGTAANPHTIHLAPGLYNIPDDILTGVKPDSHEYIQGRSAHETYIHNLWLRDSEDVYVSGVTIHLLYCNTQVNTSLFNCILTCGELYFVSLILDSEIDFMNCLFFSRVRNVFQMRNSSVNVSNSIIVDYVDMCTSSSTDVPSIQYSLTENYWPGIGNITGDPNLIDPDTFDYRLRAGSPCIDAGNPDDPVPPGGGNRIDMGCFEYPHQPQFYLDTVTFDEVTGDHDGIPEIGETIRPTLMVCNFGEPATNAVADFTLVHPDAVMTIPNVTIGDLDFDECCTIDGPTFEVTGQSGWGIPVTLTGEWTAGRGQGTMDIPFSLHGKTIHVDPVNGNDQTGTGALNSPLKTIRKSCLKAVGSRFFPMTVQMTDGVFSESSNGEYWPIYMNEYEDLRGSGKTTSLINETYRSTLIQSSRTSSFYDFSMMTFGDEQRGGIRADCVQDVTFSGLSSPYYEENGCAVSLRSKCRATITQCKLGGAGKEWHYTAGDEIFLLNSELEYSAVLGNSTIIDCILGPGRFFAKQEIPYPSNTVEYNIITAGAEIKNQNVFENNICYGVWIETEVDFPIQNNFGYGTFLVNESSGTVSFNNNIVVRDTWGPNSFECWWSAAPECNNCISIPLIRTQGEFNNYSGSYGAIGLDGSVAMMGYTGIDHPTCWQTRNSVCYYNLEDNSACVNTTYSDLKNCPGETNIDADPGFVGIGWISDIGPDSFTDATAAWEPGRYAGYYVNPDALDGEVLYYCTGNTEDTIYVMGDPRVSAEVGDLFLLPDVRLRRVADGFAYDSPLIDAGDPNILDPDGTRRDIGPYGGPYALTPMPAIPTWPPPEHTPTPPPTPSPTFTPSATTTPTATPHAVGVEIMMPDNLFASGDTFWCTVSVMNGTPETLTGYPLWVILDVYGDLFIAPSFNTTGDAWPGPWIPGETLIPVLKPFTWPDTGTSASGIWWYAALTNPEVTEIYGEWDAFEFGWGPPSALWAPSPVAR